MNNQFLTGGMIGFNFTFVRVLMIIYNRYLGSESDVSVLMRGAHLIFKLARSEPLRSQLEFHDENWNKGDYLWVGDQDPNKVRSASHPSFFVATR